MNVFGTKLARVHVGKQNIDVLQTRKLKALGRRRKEQQLMEEWYSVVLFAVDSALLLRQTLLFFVVDGDALCVRRDETVREDWRRRWAKSGVALCIWAVLLDICYEVAGERICVGSNNEPWVARATILKQSDKQKISKNPDTLTIMRTRSKWMGAFHCQHSWIRVAWNLFSR